MLDRLVGLLVVMMWASCSTMKATEGTAGQSVMPNRPHPLVVLTDGDVALYDQVVVGIHVAARGNYQLWQLHHEGFQEGAFLQQLIMLKPKALIALGPRSTHAIASGRVMVPSVFSMVPRIENYDVGTTFIAGVRMVPDLPQQLALVRQLTPDVKGLGVFMSRYTNRATIEKLRSLCDDEQFDLVVIDIQSQSDVVPALGRYQREIGAVLMLEDPVLLDVDVIKNMSLHLSAHGRAFFALDCSMVEAGALASFGTNFFSLGRELVDILEKSPPSGMYQPTHYKNPSLTDLCINIGVAKKLGIEEEIVMRATEFAARKGMTIKVYQ